MYGVYKFVGNGVLLVIDKLSLDSTKISFLETELGMNMGGTLVR